MSDQNLTLMTDKYQINMIYAHWKNGTHRKKRVFEAYYRHNPFGNGFVVFAGLERIIQYLQLLKFTDEMIAYLAVQEEQYDSDFLEYLRTFTFSGTLRAVPEGTIIFPNEPIIQVEATVAEAQLVETAILTFLNYQSLIATKAARIRLIAPDEVLLEFGTRRAQEVDAAVWGARATYIVGFDATSNLMAGMQFGIPTKGTHAHSWVQDHDSEEDAFEGFARALPNQASFLVDTYDTLRSGLPSAIRVAKKMEQQGKQLRSIRIDSGDLAYLSKEARRILDEADLPYVKIIASNDLDENLIVELKNQGARIDVWGIGTKLITAYDQPALGGVYKVVSKEENGEWLPTIKISGNPEKVTTPGRKKLYRIMNLHTGKAEGDYIALEHEDVVNQPKLKLFDPIHTYHHKFVVDFEAQELLELIYEEGNLVYTLPTLQEIRSYHQRQLSSFWEEYMRRLNPEQYPVDLSQELWDLKYQMIQQKSMEKRV
ncbi:MAG TPA: nicotinate phosphoribosyltransferase [Bacillota bacterium]|nr:nicotinate phosphoribosyltransferase [Bacillota bacterium]